MKEFSSNCVSRRISILNEGDCVRRSPPAIEEYINKKAKPTCAKASADED